MVTKAGLTVVLISCRNCHRSKIDINKRSYQMTCLKQNDNQGYSVTLSTRSLRISWSWRRSAWAGSETPSRPSSTTWRRSSPPSSGTQREKSVGWRGSSTTTRKGWAPPTAGSAPSSRPTPSSWRAWRKLRRREGRQGAKLPHSRSVNLWLDLVLRRS